jgi:uncharacterized protein (UPF0212 family)
MVERICPACGADFETVWQVTVGTNLQGYKPVFGKAPVAIDIGRCNNCNTTFESVDGGPWERQDAQ